MESQLAGDREHGGDQDALQRQQVEEGLFPLEDWDRSTPGRYALHLANSLHWCAITGSPPPMAPARARTDRHAAAARISRMVGATPLLDTLPSKAS